jgi:predicted RNase H-like nuclease
MRAFSRSRFAIVVFPGPAMVSSFRYEVVMDEVRYDRVPRFLIDLVVLARD